MILVAVVLLLLLFVLHFYRAHFNSDDAVVNTLASAMWEQGRLLPRGWVNNNGDLMVPSGALIVAPLLRWLPNGYFVHALAGVFAIGFMLGSLAYLLRMLQIALLPALLLMTVVASGLSFGVAVFVFTQTTYVWWTAGFFLAAALVVDFRRIDASRRSSRWIRATMLFGLVFCISFANPGRVGLMMVLPLYLFDAQLRRGVRESGVPPAGLLRILGAGDALTCIGIVAAFASAWALYAVLKYVGVTEMSYGAAALHWGGWPSVWRHIATFGGWFDYLGAGRPLLWNFSTTAVSRAFRFVTAAWLTWIAVSEIAMLCGRQDSLRSALVVALIGSFVPIFFIYALFEPLAIDGGTLRYFNVPIFILIVLGAFQMRDLLGAFPRVGSILFVLLGSAAVPAAADLYLWPAAPTADRFWDLKPLRQEKLAKLLEDEGLRWGYATWWNAGATTVLSDSVVRVVPVVVKASGISLSPIMALRSWYDPNAWRGKTFVALAQGESSPEQIEDINVEIGEPSRVVHSPDYEVLVYDHNIMMDLSCPTEWFMDSPVVAASPSARVTAVRLLLSRDNSRVRGLAVSLRNEGDTPVSGSGRYPVSVGVRLLDRSGKAIAPDWVHAPLRCPLPGGQERVVRISLPERPMEGAALRVDVVQEGVAWFGDRGVPSITVGLPGPTGGS